MRDKRERLRMIAAIIERVDNRAIAADGPVTPTREEITTDEIKAIYGLAMGTIVPFQRESLPAPLDGYR